MKIMAVGSEATVYEDDGSVIKQRSPKRYRIKEIDEKLRKSRSRMEFKVMQKCYQGGINVPMPIRYSEKTKRIWMSRLNGKRLSEDFDTNRMYEVGEMVGKLHKLGIIHGDLTTANIMNDKEKLFLIDFGLSYYSVKDEDRASDIFLFKNALKSKHANKYKDAYLSFLDGYKSIIGKEFKGIDTHLKDIEERRRYHESY